VHYGGMLSEWVRDPFKYFHRHKTVKHEPEEHHFGKIFMTKIMPIQYHQIIGIIPKKIKRQ
jgi:hypothetical protein